MSKVESMDTPITREEFEYRFHLLREQINRGKFHVASGIDLGGLEKVRFLPNGRIDLLSVNEQARLSANMTKQFDPERIQELMGKQENY